VSIFEDIILFGLAAVVVLIALVCLIGAAVPAMMHREREKNADD
jgi:hypothetical protein